MLSNKKKKIKKSEMCRDGKLKPESAGAMSVQLYAASSMAREQEFKAWAYKHKKKTRNSQMSVYNCI